MSKNQKSTRKLVAIMFADIVGYTAMMQEDEARAKQVRDRHREVIESSISSHSGEIIQYYGDGALSIFNSAKEAVLSAQEIQQKLQKEPIVPLRVGIHIGDIVRDEDGIYGDGVNVASRIESLGISGAVLLSDKVQLEIANHPKIKTVSLGKFHFKNVKRQIEVFALDHVDIKVPAANDIASHVHKKITRTIAVIPFTNMSANDESDYFADGVSEEIINGLTKVDGLSLISRTTCMAIKKSAEDSMTIGKRLNVSHILEGSVRKAGNLVRVNVQLVNTTDGFQLWSEMFERNMENIFEVQDEIAKNAVNALKVSFELQTKSTQIVTQPTQNLEAYNLYLKGMYHWKKGNPDGIKKAMEMFERAVSMDSDFGPALSGLSNCYSFLGSCGVMPPIKAYAKAHDYALAAIENNPKSAEAHLAMARLKFIHFWDWNSALVSLKKADSLGLNSGLMHQTYGLILAAVGKLPEAFRRMKKAVQLDPLSVPVMSTLSMLYIFDEQYEKAIELSDEIIELDPTFRKAFETKGIALMCMGKLDDALIEFTTYHKLVNHPLKGLTGLILANAEFKKFDKVNDYFEKLRQRKELEPATSLEIDFAIVNYGLGNYEQAIDYLYEVYDKRFSIVCLGMIWVARCPFFKPLWSQPRYRALKEKMGLE